MVVSTEYVSVRYTFRKQFTADWPVFVQRQRGMYRDGHLGINALLYAPIAAATILLGAPRAALVGVIVFVGLASLPDIDRLCQGMQSTGFNLWALIPIEHRGFTHTVYFSGLIGVVVGGPVGIVLTLFIHPRIVEEVSVATLLAEPTLGLPFMFSVGVAAGGIIGHIAGDAITPMGVTPFSPPIDTKYTANFCNASNGTANSLFLAVGFVVLVASVVISSSIAGYWESELLWSALTEFTVFN